MQRVECDVLVAGSGAGGLTAAITAAQHGLEVIVTEKEPLFGGTTAYSAGGIWIPCSSHASRAGVSDSADEALRHLDAAPPTVLVADLGMPHVDGFQLITEVRRHRNPRVRSIPAAALTAYARSEDRVRALRAGFHLHLAKPIDPAELVSTVAAMVRTFASDGPDGAQ